jgi:uncharacterized protein (DUF362 family)
MKLQFRPAGFNSKQQFVKAAGRVLWLLATAVAFCWFLARVIPKPIRATYPCQRAAFPLATTFVIWLLGIKAGLIAWFKFDPRVRHIARAAGLTIALCLLGAAAIAANQAIKILGGSTVRAMWTPPDPANSPIGTPRGIFPGRVVWTHNTNATKWDGNSNYWWTDANTDQATVDDLFSKAVRTLTGAGTDNDAWDALFHYHNQSRGRGAVGYTAGETIAIKINLNNLNYDTKTDNLCDATPATVLTVVRQLAQKAGVPDTNIIVYDATSRVGDFIVQKVTSEFPGVIFVQQTVGNTWGNREAAVWVTNAFSYSNPALTDSNARSLPTRVVDATYLINLALLKQHGYGPAYNYGTDGQNAVTLCGKNHFGSIANPSALHAYIRPSAGGITYNPIVDLIGTRHLGGKTLLFVQDGLYGGTRFNSTPTRFAGAPFNNHWPSCVLVSQDPVAIDSVGHDILNNFSPQTLWTNADTYLHEAALANSGPSNALYSGTVYRPDGTNIPSLGVHEHWNNAFEWKYSGNLGGAGIELVRVETAQTPPSPTFAGITVSNNSAVLTAATTAGSVYRMDFADSLPDAAWTPLGPAQTAYGETLKFIDPAANGSRFYRIVLLQ